MIDWVNEVNNKKYWKSLTLIRCLLINQLKLKKFLQDQPTKDGIKFLLELSPNLHHAPRLNKDVNRDSNPHREQDKTSCPTQTHHHRQIPRPRRQQAPPPPPPPRQDREPPPQQAEYNYSDQDWIAANVGKVRLLS
jgi:hypothetical protein